MYNRKKECGKEKKYCLFTKMCITLCKRITEAKNVEDSTKNGRQDSGYPRK